MKPWLIKFLFVSGSAGLIITGLGVYANHQSANLSGYQASVFDATTLSLTEETQASDSAETVAQPESTEITKSENSQTESGELPAPVVSPPVVFSVVPSAPAAPAFISVPSGGSGGGTVSQPAVVVAPSADSQLEISVAPASSTPPTLEDQGRSSDSADVGAETSFICTPEPGTVLINELFIDMVGADTQEFIKLYNPTEQDISLASSSMQYLSALSSGIDKITKKNFGAQAKIAAKGSYLIGTGTYDGPPADMLWSQALSNTGASVLLVSNTEVITGIDDPDILDRVAYGSGTLLFPEGLPALLPPAGKTLIRKSLGLDTDDNQVDFIIHE